MATVIPDQIAADKVMSKDDAEYAVDEKSDTFRPSAPLGKPIDEKKFWFQRTKKNSYDPHAIATLPSVFDVPEIADQYKPRDDWENIGRFDPSARWTWGEEFKLIRKMDFRIMSWCMVMFMAMELDRANLAQALSDTFLEDLGFDTNVYNLGNTVFAVCFLSGEFPSQLLNKWLGPDRWIPSQIVLFSVVCASQFALNSKSSFLACRALIGFLQGGFIPEIVLYLSYWYKHHELTLRLSFFWTGMFIADILAAIIAYGLLHMGGVQGYSGWRWLFLIEGLITGTVGIISYLLIPPGPTQTASWFRGKHGWFTEREETIMVNRLIRDDPGKGTMHNRQPVTLSLIWMSLKDHDLWPLYIIGMCFNIPTLTPTQYLIPSLRALGFSTFESNLLTIPYLVVKIFLMLGLATLAEVTGQLAGTASLLQFWSLPFLIYLRVVDTTKVSKWLTWGMTSLLLAAPLGHPVQVGWVSRNASTVRSRTVGAALYNMFLHAGVITSSNIYRTDDAPLYRRGNSILIGIACLNIVLYGLAKLYYVRRNRSRDQKWQALTPEEKLVYLSESKDLGNKKLDFRFAS
ncbi:major facilitator superfamily domain-containing protein [Pestalotiopsis sp. NC0098]|nr:major facilitator superfamily domain-containing protein [Pestalotiopsis sp. NC0098]